MKAKDIAAIVTGGSSGLGEATVRQIIKSGGKAAIIDINEEKGKAIVSELGANVIYLKADVGMENEVSDAVDAAAAKMGLINTVVNCAGIITAGRIVGKDGPHKLDAFEKIIRVNLIGTFNVVRFAAVKMTQNAPGEENERGVIVNTASIAAQDGQIGQAAYAASKGGVIAMTLPMAREFAASGIRVVTLAPGMFDTPMMGGMPAAVKESLVNQIPYPKRFGNPEEYAALVLHIAENRMLNGTVIRLDGAVRMGAR